VVWPAPRSFSLLAVVPRSDPAGSLQRGNGHILLDKAGGLFIDRC